MIPTRPLVCVLPKDIYVVGKKLGIAKYPRLQERQKLPSDIIILLNIFNIVV